PRMTASNLVFEPVFNHHGRLYHPAPSSVVKPRLNFLSATDQTPVEHGQDKPRIAQMARFNHKRISIPEGTEDAEKDGSGRGCNLLSVLSVLLTFDFFAPCANPPTPYLMRP